MKIIPALLAVLGIALGAAAQTNSYVPKGTDMRIVEGKMYNRVLSTNWVTLPAAGATLEVVDVVSGGVVVKTTANSGEEMIIKHYPEEKKLAKGKTITTSFRAMPVTAAKYGEQTVATYDCGLPNTAENRKTLTNGPIHAAQ